MTEPKDNSSSPLISVIIPTYNEGPTIGVTIQSIIEQTYEKLEIIVVDDGSTDETDKIVAEYVKLDSRIRYIKCPYDDPYRTDIRGTNVGVGWVARNYAMDQSLGEWITFQDADDASLLNRIEIQYNLAIQYNAICVTANCIKFDEKYLGKKLDVEQVFRDLNDLVVEPNTISSIAEDSKGILMRGKFPHWLIPFTFKKRWPTRLLFMKKFIGYPGADSAPFFKRETISRVRFRPRNRRVWPAISGRGVGRDHLFQLAETYGKNYSFKIPLYLWRVGGELPQSIDWSDYLI